MILRYLRVTLFTVIGHYFLNNGYASTNPDQIRHYEYILMKFPELPSYYEELRSQNPHLESKLSITSKRIICGKFFGPGDVIAMDTDQNKAKLQIQNQIIFEELFREEEQPKGVLSKFKVFGSRRGRYVYENASKIRTFLVDGREREENTFVCIRIRNSDETQHFDVYFVSDYAYDVNDARDGENFSGRFVFFGNQIYALAEVHPLYYLSRRPSNLTYLYFRKKNGHTLAEKWEEDPVCKLDRGRKFRLCTYVCVQVSAECHEKRIEAHEPCSKRKYTMEGHDAPVNEWMLTCEISSSTHTKEYLVTRSYTDNEAFVFVMDGKLLLKHVLISVSVVVDKADRKLKDLERKETNSS